MGKWYLFIAALGIFLAGTYNNCSDNGKLQDSGQLFNSSTTPTLTPSPPSPATDSFLANEYGGSGAMINSGLTNQVLLFQDTFAVNLFNRDGTTNVKINGVHNPFGMGAYVDPNDQSQIKFFIVDRGNHRVLIFNKVPSSGTAVPDVVVGQTDFVSGLANAGQATVNAIGLNDPVDVSVCGDGKMTIADRLNNRILIYNKIPKTNGATPDLVMGQPDFVTNVAAAGATGLNTPYAGYCFDKKLFIIDRSNQRIVVHNTFPTINNAPADFVIGQPDFTTVTPGCAANKFNTVFEIVRYQNELYVVDGNNHRILRFITIPTNFGAVAANVIGQANFTTCTANQGLVAAAANTLNTPNSLAVGKNTLAATDFGNNRVLFYSLPVTTDNSNAISVLGQPDLATSTSYVPPSATSVNHSKGMIFDGGYLWITNGSDNRVLTMKLPIAL